MFFVRTPCSACERGDLGFFCAAGGEMVLVCDRCDAVFPDPTNATAPADEAILDGGHWAGRDEVEAAGFDHLILGEHHRSP